TFQGRDVFASVAAWFSRGLPMARFGEPVNDYQTIPMPVPDLSQQGVLLGEVIHIDRFGNAITNITRAELNMLLGSGSHGPFKIMLKEQEVLLKAFYEQGGDSRLHSLINSSGYLEFFIYQGRAADQYHITTGDQVSVMTAQG
ncbi:MAG: SAM hydroxide adenosyltransferase, partial [Thermodesulfovibrionales bacterium]